MNTKLTVGEVAKRLGLSPSGVRKAADAGRLRCARDEHGSRLFAIDDVEQFELGNNSLAPASVCPLPLRETAPPPASTPPVVSLSTSVERQRWAMDRTDEEVDGSPSPYTEVASIARPSADPRVLEAMVAVALQRLEAERLRAEGERLGAERAVVRLKETTRRRMRRSRVSEILAEYTTETSGLARELYTSILKPRVEGAPDDVLFGDKTGLETFLAPAVEAARTFVRRRWISDTHVERLRAKLVLAGWAERAVSVALQHARSALCALGEEATRMSGGQLEFVAVRAACLANGLQPPAP